MTGYKTLKIAAESTEIINKSKFISYAAPVHGEEEAQSIIAQRKALFPDATHCCWAYVTGIDGNTIRFSDDGEPSSTAGRPILDCLLKPQITESVITVTRYFGGVLLGTGGLVRAYSSGASAAVALAGTVQMQKSCEYLVFFDYPQFSRAERTLREAEYIILTGVDYAEAVGVHCVVKQADSERFLAEIGSLSSGSARTELCSSVFYPWS